MVAILPIKCATYSTPVSTNSRTITTKAAATLDLLWNDALLLPASPVWIGEERWPSYRPHDLLHDVACRLLIAEQPKGLGIALPSAHAYLLEQYRTQTEGGGWHTLPNDGYIHAHLVWHMEQAGWAAEIHTLLREETADRQNGWYKARSQLGQVAGYLADVERAWRLVDETCPSTDDTYTGLDVGRQTRYALVTASLSSLATNIPPALLAVLVEKGVWPHARGLASARQIPGPETRSAALAGLVPVLTPQRREVALQESLVAAREIEHEGARVSALAMLASHLSEPERSGVLQEALLATREIGQDYDWSNALAALAPFLSEPLLGEALSVAVRRECVYANARSQVLAALAPYLPEPLLLEALGIVRGIEDEVSQSRALAALAPFLTESLLQEALSVARDIQDEELRARALAALVPRLSKPLLREQVEVVRGMENIGARAQVLAALCFSLPDQEQETELREVLAAAREEGDERLRSKALVALASSLQESLLREALAVSRGMGSGLNQSDALASLLPRLAELGHPQEALAGAQEITTGSRRAIALGRLAHYLTEESLYGAVVMAERIEDAKDRTSLVYTLASRLAESGHIREALSATRMAPKTSPWGYNRAEVLLGLVSQLAESGRARQALEVTQRIYVRRLRLAAVGRLAPYLPEPFLQEALAELQMIGDSDVRTLVLSALRIRLPKLCGEDTSRKALSMAQEIEDQNVRAWALADLAPHLSKEGLLEVLRAAQEIVDSILIGDTPTPWGLGVSPRTQVLIGVIPHLPQCHMQETLALAFQLNNSLGLDTVLESLVPRLSEALLEEALKLALTREGFLRWEALRTLTRHLPEPLVREALLAVNKMDDDWSGRRSDVLAGLTVRLAELSCPENAVVVGKVEPDHNSALLLASQSGTTEKGLSTLSEMAELDPERALIAAWALPDPHARAKVLAWLAPRLDESPSVTTHVLAGILHKRSTPTRQILLANVRALAPVIARLGGEEAIAEICRAIQDVGRWWP